MSSIFTPYSVFPVIHASVLLDIAVIPDALMPKFGGDFRSIIVIISIRVVVLLTPEFRVPPSILQSCALMPAIRMHTEEIAVSSSLHTESSAKLFSARALTRLQLTAEIQE